MVLRRRPIKLAQQKRIAGNKAELWGRLTGGLSKLKGATPAKKLRFALFLQQNGFRKSLKELEKESDALFITLNEEAFAEPPSYAISSKEQAGHIRQARRFLTLLHEAERKGIF